MFVDNVIAVDPLDRPLYGQPDENGDIEDHGTKISDLRALINGLEPIEGSSLFVPLADEKYRQLRELFETAHCKSTESLMERFENAKI